MNSRTGGTSPTADPAAALHTASVCWLTAPATTLTAVGLAGVAPAAVAGWADWADLPPEQARVGLAHAVSNVAYRQSVEAYAGT
ncbi:hypothetical protein [Streptomyces sp. NPDC051546]|uniref:hypothetical protein n=1 Tax=Streptomyces sp. NPDC051546 TaxID=3365655 RepID=UPI0037B3CCFC